MSDLIRREDAIKILSQRAEILRGEYGDLGGACSGALKIIKAIPSAEPEPKWIPVTEALPEEEKDVLVSVHFDGYKDEYINYPPSDYVEIASYIDGVWSSIYDDFKTMRRLHHIVAWMEEPKPYRGE